MEVDSWLQNLGLGSYASAFHENAVDIEILPHLTEGDFEKLGIPLGDRKRLIKALSNDFPGALVTSEAEQNAPSGYFPPADAERRHLTVMICDLVGSTALSARLDPEELAAVMHAFQGACARITQTYDGFLADYRGDGVLAYFGYPHAHEDDAERAVRAGLEFVTAVARLETPAPEPISVRIGIASGLVVVGYVGGEGASRKHALAGDTPNFAARVQALAEPGAVVIAASTRRLLGDRFCLRDLGLHQVKGIAEPVSAWAVDGYLASERRFEADYTTDLADLVGRQNELAFLLKRLRVAWKGAGEIVLISGESGIGKSRLAAALEKRIADEPHTVSCYQCSPYHTNSPLYPFIAQLERAAGFMLQDTSQERLQKLEALLARAGPLIQDTTALFAALLAIPCGEHYSRLTINPAQQRRRTCSALLDQFESLARQGSMLLLFEDLHWADSSSLELLDRAVERMRHLPVLACFTFRPDFEPSWIDLPNLSALSLVPLQRGDVETLVSKLTGGCALPPEVMNEIIAKTDGNPLFVEELTKAVLEEEILVKDAEGYRLAGPLPPLAIPDTLQDTLMARLSRLGPAKEIAQVGAAVGREFSYSLMCELVGRDETALRHALGILEERELVFRSGEPPDASYSFKHALVRDTAYQSLLKSRRKQLHGQIARTIDANFPDVAANLPEIVAHHFTEAGLVDPAIDYWLKSGNLALSRSPNAAIAHLEQGLKLIPGVENLTLRNKSELLLQISLGNALRATKGWSADSVRHAYTRALELSIESMLDKHSFPAVFGLWSWNFLRAELHEARALAERLLNSASNINDSVYKVLAHEAVGFTLFAQGRFVTACAELENSISMCKDSKAAAYLEASAQDPRVHARLYHGLALWFLGYPDQALRVCAEAQCCADASQNSFSKAMARVIRLRVHQLRGEAAIVAGQVNDAIALCEEHEFGHYLAMALILQGWAIAQLGEYEKGITEMQGGLEKERATGALLYESRTLALLADAYIATGHYGQAVECLQKAELRLHQNGSERFYAAEIYRLLGEAHLRSKNRDQAEHYFFKGLGIARDQKAKSLELRLCVNMYDLYEPRQNGNKYRSQLGEIYGSFSEGFDTRDLVRAKARLKEIA
jgi:predicted ATPase/class 3 adenylate cyclase